MGFAESFFRIFDGMLNLLDRPIDFVEEHPVFCLIIMASAVGLVAGLTFAIVKILGLPVFAIYHPYLYITGFDYSNFTLLRNGTLVPIENATNITINITSRMMNLTG